MIKALIHHDNMKKLPVTDLSLPSELLETCAHCGEHMYTIVRAHHHTEDGKDVTK